MARLFTTLLLLACTFGKASAQDPYFFAGKGGFNPSIPDPPGL
jgi:hypothetical protein